MLLRPRPLVRAGMFGGAMWMGQRMQARAAEPGPAVPPPIDVVSRLRELKEMLDSGALTQQEFDAAKQRLLATT